MSKHYDVEYILSNGKKRTVVDVKADAPDQAVIEAQEYANSDEVVINIEDKMYILNKKHIVEKIIKEVPSSEVGKKRNEAKIQRVSY